MTRRYRVAAQGMTLLELLVALAIMAISLGMIYRATGSSARSVGDMANYQYAVQLAESLMSMRDSVYESGWSDGGDSNGYRWQIQSAPYQTEIQGPNIPMLFQVHISVAWNEGSKQRSIELDTLRPVRRPPDPAANLVQ